MAPLGQQPAELDAAWIASPTAELTLGAATCGVVYDRSSNTRRPPRFTTPSTPRELRNLLRGRWNNQGTSPRFLALAPGGAWFAQFLGERGRLSDNAPATLRAALAAKSGAEVTELAFAPGGGFFVQWHDGLFAASSPLPKSLARFLRRTCGSASRGTSSVDRLAIGPLGEWVAVLDDGVPLWGGNLPPRLKAALQRARSTGRRVSRCVLGGGGQWAIEFERARP